MDKKTIMSQDNGAVEALYCNPDTGEYWAVLNIFPYVPKKISADCFQAWMHFMKPRKFVSGSIEYWLCKSPEEF